MHPLGALDTEGWIRASRSVFKILLVPSAVRDLENEGKNGEGGREVDVGEVVK